MSCPVLIDIASYRRSTATACEIASTFAYGMCESAPVCAATSHAVVESWAGVMKPSLNVEKVRSGGRGREDRPGEVAVIVARLHRELPIHAQPVRDRDAGIL